MWRLLAACLDAFYPLGEVTGVCLTSGVGMNVMLRLILGLLLRNKPRSSNPHPSYLLVCLGLRETAAED